jgi:hypothetical protein
MERLTPLLSSHLNRKSVGAWISTKKPHKVFSLHQLSTTMAACDPFETAVAAAVASLDLFALPDDNDQPVDIVSVDGI